MCCRVQHDVATRALGAGEQKAAAALAASLAGAPKNHVALRISQQQARPWCRAERYCPASTGRLAKPQEVLNLSHADAAARGRRGTMSKPPIRSPFESLP